MIYVYIKKERGTKTFLGALYLTNNKFCTMGRSWREEVSVVFYQAQESLYSIGKKKNKLFKLLVMNHKLARLSLLLDAITLS